MSTVSTASGAAAALTVLILHGVHQHAGFYERFAAGLTSSGFKARALDLPGFGPNHGPVDRAVQAGGQGVPCSTSNVLSFDVYTKFLIAEIERTEGPVVVFGHSLGGLVATYAALDPAFPPPTKVVGFILSSPSLRIAPALEGCVGAVVSALSSLTPNVTLASLDVAETTDNAELRKRWETDAMVEAGLPFRMGYVAAARAAQLKIGTIFGDPSKALLPSKTLILHGTLDREVHDHGSCVDLLANSGKMATFLKWPVKHEVLFEFRGWGVGDGSNPALDAVVQWLRRV